MQILQEQSCAENFLLAVAPRFLFFLEQDAPDSGRRKRRISQLMCTLDLESKECRFIGFIAFADLSKDLEVGQSSWLFAGRAFWISNLHYILKKGYSAFSYMLSCVYQVDCRTFGAFQAVGTKLCHSILIPERIDGDLVGEQVASEVSSTKTIPRCQHQGWEIGVYGCGIVKTTRLIVCVSLKHGCFMLFLTYPFPVCDDWMWHTQLRIMKTFDNLDSLGNAVLNFILSRTIRTSGCLVSMKVLWSQWGRMHQHPTMENLGDAGDFA